MDDYKEACVGGSEWTLMSRSQLPSSCGRQHPPTTTTKHPSPLLLKNASDG